MSAFSKIFEKAIYSRVLQFLDCFHVVSDSQHGFRPRRSAETAIVDFVEYVRVNLGNKKYVAGLFFDLSAAFDSVDGGYIKEKLYAIGIRGNTLNLILSFLHDRKLCVDVNGMFSQKCDVKLGVPQGSTLGPLIFVLFINDLSNNICDGHVLSYADDTSVAVAGDSMNDLECRISKIIKNMNDWCRRNRLILNSEKTVRINFYLKNSTVKPPLNCDECTKFLGVHVDSALRWNQQIDSVISRVNKSYYVILKLKNCMDRNGLLQVYYSMVHSHLSYGILVWGRACEMSRLFVAQKRIIRLIFNIKRGETCRDTFIKYDIITLPGIYLYRCGIFAHVNRHLFSTNAQYHEYGTRNRESYCIPNHRTASYEKSPHYASASVYNRLPESVKDCNLLCIFKKRLRKYLIENCFYTVSEFFT